MNKFIIIGNLTKDPELASTASGVSVCRFTVAVTRDYTSGGERKTDFFNVTAWRALGESVAKFCEKGNKIAVVGSIQMRMYEGNDGVKRNVVDVIAESVEFLTRKENGQRRNESGEKNPLQYLPDDTDVPW